MKLLRKFVNALSASRTDFEYSIDKISGPTKRRKTIDNDDVPLQIIQLPIGASVLELNQEQYEQIKRKAAKHLEPILRKCLRMNKKEAAKTISSLQNCSSPTTTSSPNSIFGCPLDQIPIELISRETQLPLVIVKLMHSFVFRGGLEQEGPFRTEGDKQQLSELVDAISQGYEAEGIEIDSYPVPVLGAAVKRYLRSIPGSLIPKETTEVLVKLFNLKNSIMRSVAIQLTLFTIPFQHAKILTSINLLLKTCALQERVHKMSAAALTVCFGPTLFEVGTDLNLVCGVNNLLHELIENYSIYSTVPTILNSH